MAAARRRRAACGDRPGCTRLFNAAFGNMMSWLLPGALLMGAVLLVLTMAGPAHRPRTGRLPALGWLPGRHRADHQLGPGHHPPLLHGRPGATVGRPRRHRHHVAVATPRLVGRSIGPGGGPGGHHDLGRRAAWIALRTGSPGSASSWRWPALSVPWRSSPSRGCAGCPSWPSAWWRSSASAPPWPRRCSPPSPRRPRRTAAPFRR